MFSWMLYMICNVLSIHTIRGNVISLMGGNNLQLGKEQLQARIQMPPLPGPLINPIGAGDAVASGTMLHWCNAVPRFALGGSVVTSNLGWNSAVEAFCWGLSCGAASCLTETNSVFDLNIAMDIRRAVEVNKDI
jgi:hypothetical protein